MRSMESWKQSMDSSSSSTIRSPAEKQDLSVRRRSIPSYTPLSSSSSSSPHQCLPFRPSSPFTSLSSSNIPFSWESRPGIPKAGGPTKPSSPNPALLLPLPPSLRSTRQQPHRRRYPEQNNNAATAESSAVDPFAVALVEWRCSPKDDSGRRWKSTDQPPALRWVDRRLKALGLMSTFDPYASCKCTSSVVDSVCIRRPGRAAKALAPPYGLLPPQPE